MCSLNKCIVAEGGADAASSTSSANSDDAYESKIGMRHWSVKHTTIPGLLMDIYENGSSTQLSGEEIAETVLDLLRRNAFFRSLN